MRPLTLLRTIHRNRRDREERPRMLTYTVTMKCNARCVMCDSWKLSGKGDLKLDEIEAIFRQLPRLDVVRLTGGEPFVRKDFGEIFELAEQHLRPLAFQITTNGFLADEIERFCEQRTKRVPLLLLVSIDGVGEKHDEIRGKSDAWERTIETIRRLAPRRKELRLRLAVNQTVIDREGIEQYRMLREALRPWGVRNQVVLAYAESATYSVERGIDLAPKEDNEYSPFGEFEASELARLFDDVEEDLESEAFAERIAKRYYLDGLRARLLGEGRGPNPRCVALFSHLRLFPNGDVPTCQFNSKVVGNLREKSFAEVWGNSAATEEQRQWVRACPGCWAECEVLPSAVYTGDLVGHAARRLFRRGRKAAAPAADALPPGPEASGLVSGNESTAH